MRRVFATPAGLPGKRHKEKMRLAPLSFPLQAAIFRDVAVPVETAVLPPPGVLAVRDTVYALRAFSNYIPDKRSSKSSHESGHYKTIIQDSDKKWWCVNDDEVSTASDEDLPFDPTTNEGYSGSAYILMYERVD